MSEDDHKDRAALVKVVTSPLGFFALSLLIVEGFLTIALIFSDLTPENKYVGMWIGAGLFCVVVIGVLVLVCWKPKNLTFGEKSHLEDQKMHDNMLIYGSKSDPKSRSEIEENSSSVPAKWS